MEDEPRAYSLTRWLPIFLVLGVAVVALLMFWLLIDRQSGAMSSDERAELTAKADEVRQFSKHQCDNAYDPSVPLIWDVHVDETRKKVVVSVGHDSGFDPQRFKDSDESKLQARFGSLVVVKEVGSGGEPGCAIRS